MSPNASNFTLDWGIMQPPNCRRISTTTWAWNFQTFPIAVPWPWTVRSFHIWLGPFLSGNPFARSWDQVWDLICLFHFEEKFFVSLIGIYASMTQPDWSWDTWDCLFLPATCTGRARSAFCKCTYRVNVDIFEHLKDICIYFLKLKLFEHMQHMHLLFGDLHGFGVRNVPDKNMILWTLHPHASRERPVIDLSLLERWVVCLSSSWSPNWKPRCSDLFEFVGQTSTGEPKMARYINYCR